MGEFPTKIEEVTVPWLNGVLSAAGGGGQVVGFSSERIGEGVGLMGKLDRISVEWQSAGPDAPTSVVGKFATDNPEALEVVKSFNFYEKEVNFYNTMADRTLSRTPVCHAAEYDGDSETFILLFEDVSTGEMGDQVAGATASQVEATAEELVKLHASWWGNDEVGASEWIYPLSHPLYTQGIPMALDGYHPISSQILDMPGWYDRYRASIGSLLERAAAMPWTLCHGDARLDNLFFDVGPDSLAVIDWQIIIQGPGVYDLAYFMSQSAPVDLRRDMESDVVTHYRDRLIELGIDPPSRAELWDAYRLATIMCTVYPVVGGGTVDPEDERGVALARAMIDRSVTASEDLGAVEFLD
ncbi:MAG: phosphotransferase [Actinomycetia bacterium]|nr:phosphotransferase [Actinomycetes bacterium]